MARNEVFTDITAVMLARGERVRKGARLIVATGGNYDNPRRYYGYYNRGFTLKLYPADAYTYKVTPRPFLISVDLIEISRPSAPPAPDPVEAARRKAAAEAAERREQRKAAIARERAEQCSLFDGEGGYA